MNRYLNEKDIKPLILLALKEDIGRGDITSNAIFNRSNKSSAIIKAKENGILCGGEIVRYIYNEIDRNVNIDILKKDGERVLENEEVIIIKGNTSSILSGERTALNFLARMSGIATKTNRICSLLNKRSIILLDTRKTIPGFRLLDKYSVKTGGGQNHRFGLYDMVMIKDNHIKAAGSIKMAVDMIKKIHGTRYKIEVETKTLQEIAEAVESGADIIMLDNMNINIMKEAIDLIGGKAKIEVSGNINEDNIKNIIDLKIDYISMGELTHSVKAFDLSMQFQ
ncbi:MAG: carboxylating nicotinate-nucleotide diphosphorylase [Spirochaetota bacterium]|nr:carboxylating nicotinate-nucleotide diphosphorylase [Spirochaetota bacterium]